MMGNYKRKSNRQLKFTPELMKEIQNRLNKGESKRHIARTIGVHEATLRKRLKAGTIPISLGRFKPVFNKEMETKFADHVRMLDNLFFGLTVRDLQSFAYQFPEQNKLQHSFNKEQKLVGKDWIKAFCNRHNLSLRQPEKVSKARASGFNPIHEGFKVIATAPEAREPNLPSGSLKSNNLTDNNYKIPITISPAKIIPLPKASLEIKRKRKGKKSEILTSSPYEQNLQETVDVIKLKTVRKNLKLTSHAKKQCTGNNQEFYCPGCGDKFKDPPEIDWIQCKLCKIWWHEICTTYSGQKIFKCDKCVPE